MSRSGSAVAISAIIIILIVLLATQHGTSKQETAATTQSQGQAPVAQTNTELQDCMNQAHQRWDSVIATDEGTPSNAYEFAKSQLDQQLAICHQQYGY
jgi:hypothetical protein